MNWPKWAKARSPWTFTCVRAAAKSNYSQQKKSRIPCCALPASENNITTSKGFEPTLQGEEWPLQGTIRPSAVISGDLDVRLNDRDLEGDRSIVCYSLSIHPPKSCHFFSRYLISLSDFQTLSGAYFLQE